MNERIACIDYMKVIGIFLVVLGHMPFSMTRFIYTFHVPMFFFLSGFLYKEDRPKLLLIKIIKKLFIPFTIIVLINSIIQTSYESLHEGGEFLYRLTQRLFYCLCGFETFHNKACLGPMWFVYSLILIKIIYISRFHYIISFLGCGVIIFIPNSNNIEITEPNAIFNTFLSIPFFYIGSFLKKYKLILLSLREKRKHALYITLVTVLIVIICGRINGTPWVYMSDYGKSFFLYLLGGFSGTIMIYSITIWIKKANSVITYISTGTILVLGFHKTIYTAIGYIPTNDISSFFYAMALVLLFYPITIVCTKHVKFIIGR